MNENPMVNKPAVHGERLDRLRGMRDDLKVRAHLAAMDIRDAWARMEPQFESLERDAKAMIATGTADVTRALDKAEEALTNFAKRLDAKKTDSKHDKV